MKKNNLKKLSGLLLILLVISTGCNKKDKELSTYEKSDNSAIQESINNNNDENKENESKNKISSIQLENGENLVVVKGYDEDNNMVWSYTTKSSYNTSASKYFEGKNNIYVNDGGNLVALNKETGNKLWNKTDCKVSDFSDSVEIEDSLYLVAEGPEYQLLVINIADGKTIKQLDTNTESNQTTTYTFSQVKGTYEVKTDTYTQKIVLSNNGVFELNHSIKDSEGYIILGNYIIENDKITLNYLLQIGPYEHYTQTESVTYKINSVNSISSDKVTFKRTSNDYSIAKQKWYDKLDEFVKLANNN